MKRNSHRGQTASSLLLLGVAAVLAVRLPTPSGARAAAAHSSVKLVAETNAVVPGRRLWLGLEFRMDSGWHIYWVNAGDSGEPPTVTWQMPKGFAAGTIEWPVPQRLGQGAIVDYGYENHVLLLVPVSTPAPAGRLSDVQFAARVEWLACKEVCVPARASVRLDLPVSSRATVSPAMRALFAGARARLPRPAPRSWHAAASDEGDDFVLTIETGKRERTATFFPLVPDQIRNSAPQAAHPTSGGVRLTLRKSDLLVGRVKWLRGLISFGGGAAYAVAAPVGHPPRRVK